MKTIFSSKFIKILKTFSKEEMKSFEVWLNSPWCNSNKNLIRLLEKIKKYYPEFDNLPTGQAGNKLTKERLFKQILPNGKFSDRRMNNILSEAYLAAERFIIFQNLSNDQNLQKDLLSKEQQSRHLEDWFFKDINKEIARLEEKEIKDWEDHLELLQLNRRMYHHPNANPRMQPGGQTIVKMGEQLDLVYLLEKAAIINEKIFRNRILKNENHEVSDELKKWRVASKGLKHPAIEFYKMRFDYTEEDMLEQYFKLRGEFLKRYKELNLKEQKMHLISLLNDTSILRNKSLLDITDSLPLYKLGLETGIILNHGKITQTTFVTIVSASNAKKDFDFTKVVIEKYSYKLENEIQKDGRNWALAHIANRQEDYQKSLSILLNSDFKVHYFRIASKILTTQVYFDLYLKDDSYKFYLFNYFDSFEKWLQREKTRSKMNIKSYLRFVQLTRALAKFYDDTNFNYTKINKVFEEPLNSQGANWLRQKKEKILISK